jgi:hypothetical protein
LPPCKNSSLKGKFFKIFEHINREEFNQLTKSLGQEFQRDKRARYERELQKGDRQRKPGGGRIARLQTPELKCFFILFYFKCYPTLDLLGLPQEPDHFQTILPMNFAHF